MGSTTDPIWREEVRPDGSALSDAEKAAVLHELDAILNSPTFQPSKRCQQFLSYVVRHRLDGNHDRLKERTIGVDLFHRPAGYATGDDPVVRVQAGELRRRLEQYYHGSTQHSTVRIELHVGSYAPEFRWERPEPAQPEPSQAHAPLQPEVAQAALGQEPPQPTAAEAQPHAANRKPVRWALAVIGLAVLVALALAGSTVYRAKAPKSTLEQFWSPALSSSEPVLICLAKPAVYLPSEKLYQLHSKTPEKFTSQFSRLSQKPNLQPDDKIVWGDMVEYPDYGLAVGDVYAATGMSALLGRIGKKNQVRIGGNYSFEDLRNSPAVVIGAFNNRWAMQMTSNLHFAFAEEGDQSIIKEEGPTGRRWRSETDANGNAVEDYAVVTRLLNSKTGQFVVVVAGIKSYGTQAAGEFVSNPEYLEKALRSAAPDWPRKNLQIVIETPVTDFLPGPPQAIAIYVW
ncbi:MAG: hypothetical protein ABR987_05800 [Terracidiphilus sp.]|jgi:hypothetical protein